MFCRNCGKEVEATDKFCSHCGEKIATVEDTTQAMPQVVPMPAQESSGQGKVYGQAVPSGYDANGTVAASAKSSTKRNAIVAAVIGAVLLIAVAVGVFIGTGMQPQSNKNAASANAGVQSTEQHSSLGTQAAAKSPISMAVSQIDNSAFPQMTMYVSLIDQNGAELTSVDAAQFSVVELGSDGAEHLATVQEIVPVSEGDAMNINLVLDQSGSMDSENKMENAQVAAHAFVSEITATSSNNAEITSFDDKVYNRQPFTNNKQLLDSAIDALDTNGGTALYDALYWALQRTNLKSGSRVVIAFTDGEENQSTYSESDVIELSRLTGIPVYLVGIGDEVNSGKLTSLAMSCNGQYYDATTSDLAQALQNIYKTIYENQRSLYRMVYASTFNGDTAAYRTVRIQCTGESPYEGTVEAEYVPVDNVSAYYNVGNLNPYVLEDSDSRYYSKSKLEELSLWELYLARNEIFARHGRGFKNQDLVDYFATRSWYSQKYTPEEFDAMPTPLNDYELKNVETMYAIESARNSPYLVTAK